MSCENSRLGTLAPHDEALIENFERAMAIPGHPINQRPGAATRLDMVNVLGWLARRDGSEPQVSRMERLRTRLLVHAWVNNVAYAKDVWADVYLLDLAGEILYAQTFGLSYVEPAGTNGDSFVADVLVPSSGLGSRSGEGRRVQFRLYYEVGGAVFTDGLLHDQEIVRAEQDNEFDGHSSRRSLIVSLLLLSQAGARSRRRRF